MTKSRIIIKVTFLLGLYDGDAINIILVDEEGTVPVECDHSRLNTINILMIETYHTAFIMAPLKSWVLLATSTKLISFDTIILREWILRIWDLASSLGRGNSIFLSNRPDLSNAGSSVSGLLVAAMTYLYVCVESSYLDSIIGTETIKLIQQLQHGSLYFTVTTLVRIETFGSNRIQLINKDDGWCLLSG